MVNKIKKFLESLPLELREKIKKRFYEVKMNGLDGDFKKLKGYKDLYRIRVGKIRIIVKKGSPNNDIEIIDIDYRGNVY